MADRNVCLTRRESPTVSDAAENLGAADDAVAGEAVAAAGEFGFAAAEDRRAGYWRDRACEAGAGRRRGRADYAESFVSLRLVCADRGGASRGEGVSFSDGVASVCD